MRTINHYVATPWEWQQLINSQIPSKISGNRLTVNDEAGEGFLEYLELQKGLWIQEIKVTLKDSVEMIRSAAHTNEIFVIDFYLFDFILEKTHQDKEFLIGFNDVSMLLTSGTSTSRLIIPKDKEFKMFHIAFSKEWLYQNVLTDLSDVKIFFDADEPIYISEDFDNKLKFLLKKVSLQDNKLSILSKVIQIIDSIFEKLKKRDLFTEKAIKVHPNDFENLVKVKSFMDENVGTEISLEMLSDIASMSLSKFKNQFKKVFGTSPYQYHLSRKMEKSMEAIQESDYNISEIGYLMGYSNLSQFSKAFKKHFGFLPSEVAQHN